MKHSHFIQKIISVVLCCALAFVPSVLHIQTVQAQGVSGALVVRDAEIEALLRDYVRPILRAAGVEADSTEIIIINDKSFNAFVADGRRIFVNLGTLMETETPNELIGVLAHETGHIAGGHLSRLHGQMASAQTMMIVGMLLGAGALAAGAARGGQTGSSIGDAGAGIMMGGQETALRSLLSYQRSEEMAADSSGARYLEATGQSAMGMVRVFDRLSQTQKYQLRNSDPYRQSHPLAKDRVSALKQVALQSPYVNVKDSPDLVRRHNLMRAKVRGYFNERETVTNLYGKQSASSDAKYARALGALKDRNYAEVVRETDSLLKSEPNNSYFHELRGQALLERGQPDAALPSLARAVAGNPKSGLIRGMYGQALLSSKNSANLSRAINELEKATQLDAKHAANYRFLGQAYGKKGDIARATLAIANEAMLTGDMEQARMQANRARSLAIKGSAIWVKADDIIQTTNKRY